MPSKDRLKKLLSGSDDDDVSETSESSGGSKKKGRSTSTGKKEKTKKQKLDEFKGKSSSSGGGTEDIKRLLFCLGNLDLYTRMVGEYEYRGLDKSQKKIKDEVASSFAGEITNFLGVFDVAEIADEYGYSWEQITNTIASNQDKIGRSMNTNPGNAKKRDVKELLDCIANIVLYVEGTKHAEEDKDNKNRRDEVTLVIADAIHDAYQSILSEVEVQRIAERHGYDWESDVLKGVLENQDFESKLEQ